MAEGVAATLASVPLTLSGGAQSASLTFRVGERPEDLVVVVDPVGRCCRYHPIWQLRLEQRIERADTGAAAATAGEPARIPAEADLEFTGTEMPYALADVLAGDAQHQKLEDLDSDGAVSLLDLYLATCLEIQERFPAIERLQTEHAQLEDIGDGHGSEVQQKYLPAPEVDGEPAASPPSPEPVCSQSLDGYRAARISLTAPG